MRLPPEAAAPRSQALNQLLRPMQTLPFDNACAEKAAQIRSSLEAIGKPIGPHDTLIAAIAIRYQSTLVTRNVAEFSRVQGLNVLNWHV